MSAFGRIISPIALAAALFAASPIFAAELLGQIVSDTAQPQVILTQLAGRSDTGRTPIMRVAESTGTSKEDVATLKQQCEDAREERIAPLRKAAIAECIAEKQKTPEECEQFYQDYGNGGVTGPGTFRQRMFHDIPECQPLYDAEKNEAEKQLKPGSR